MKQENIILIGGGGHCHGVIDVIEQENKYNILGIIDQKEKIGETVLGYKIIGCDDDLESLFIKCKNAFITIGHIKTNQPRVELYNKLKNIGFTLPVIISPFAYVSQHATIEEGSVIMHQALINANVKIGRNCIINSKALLEHDVKVEDHCHISTASVLNGGVVVKSNCFYGSNAVSKQAIEIKGFVKAGSIIK